MNTIVNMFPSKVKEDNDALVRYFVECKLVVREQNFCCLSLSVYSFLKLCEGPKSEN